VVVGRPPHRRRVMGPVTSRFHSRFFRRVKGAIIRSPMAHRVLMAVRVGSAGRMRRSFDGRLRGDEPRDERRPPAVKGNRGARRTFEYTKWGRVHSRGSSCL